jgi:predicted enzyme involved in methoxymalonyl-ACP biosynthesis
MLYSEGIEKVTATYIPTAKNHQVSEFYEKVGFEKLDEKDGIKEYKYTLCEPSIIEEYYKINRL